MRRKTKKQLTGVAVGVVYVLSLTALHNVLEPEAIILSIAASVPMLVSIAATLI